MAVLWVLLLTFCQLAASQRGTFSRTFGGEVANVEDLNGGSARDEAYFTIQHVKNPSRYWGELNHDTHRIQPLRDVRDPVFRFSDAQFQTLVQKLPKLPKYHVKAYRGPHVLQRLMQEREYIGNWLGLGRDLTLPMTSAPDGFKFPEDDLAGADKNNNALREAAAAVNGQVSGDAPPASDSASPRFLSLRPDVPSIPVEVQRQGPFEIIHVPRVLQVAAEFGADPMAQTAFFAPPKMEPPPAMEY